MKYEKQPLLPYSPSRLAGSWRQVKRCRHSNLTRLETITAPGFSAPRASTKCSDFSDPLNTRGSPPATLLVLGLALKEAAPWSVPRGEHLQPLPGSFWHFAGLFSWHPWDCILGFRQITTGSPRWVLVKLTALYKYLM